MGKKNKRKSGAPSTTSGDDEAASRPTISQRARSRITDMPPVVCCSYANLCKLSPRGDSTALRRYVDRAHDDGHDEDVRAAGDPARLRRRLRRHGRRRHWRRRRAGRRRCVSDHSRTRARTRVYPISDAAPRAKKRKQKASQVANMRMRVIPPPHKVDVATLDTSPVVANKRVFRQYRCARRPVRRVTVAAPVV